MSDRGYASILVLGLMLAGLLLTGLTVDVARLVAQWREALHLAQVAAETGAGWVDTDSLYRGELEVDPGRATEAARGVVGDGDWVVEVDVSSSRICVTVSAEVAPGLIQLVGAAPKAVAASSCAEPAMG